MSTCEHGYTRFWDCPYCDDLDGEYTPREHPRELKEEEKMRTFKASRIQHGIAHVTLDGRALSLRLDLRRHSPTGPEWGYGGSGPAQLALAMCCAVAGDERGQNVYQDFKAKVLASIQQDEWEMTEEQVLRVVEGIEAARLAGHTA